MGDAGEVNWDIYAKEYDVLMELSPYRDMLGKVARIIEKSGSMKLLDAATGTGNLFSFLEANIIRQAVGIDSSVSMLNRAKKKCPNTEFLWADLNKKLPFSDEGFDVVTSVNTLYATAIPSVTLNEYRRALRKNGYLIIVTPRQGFENGLVLKRHCGSNKPDEYWFDAHASAEREEALIREAIDDEVTVQKLLFVAKVNRYIATNLRFHFFTQDKLRALLIDAGLLIESYGLTYAGQSHLFVARKV